MIQITELKWVLMRSVDIVANNSRMLMTNVQLVQASLKMFLVI